MPTTITGYTRLMVWANLVVNILIVGTGGLVRLTGSGLGCSQWPLCTGDSLVPTPELGIHGVIEFGNRTITGVLIIVALAAFLAVVRTPRSLGLPAPALWVGILIIVQALVGGATVLLKLDPRLVSVHFLLSAAAAAVAAVLLQRVRLAQEVPGKDAVAPYPAVSLLTFIVVAMVWITELLGVLTTGAGPHAGDSAAARNGLNTEIMEHVHSVPGYLLVASLVLLLVVVFRQRAGVLPRTKGTLITLFVLVCVQIGFGIFQSRTGLPIWSVAIHMLLAATIVAVATILFINVRRAQ